ncbi:Uu.00g008500.m01.CDS01 [Anthostomella pinea]|uniref:Uu.00g008500.m01.CDS01 n=1 Tax=Anthostomella pinea TaxID=933095 RepID=A0AAI8VRG6_9PEZI|nr:Uu.00g008500.m01.CDS01 [Anthostomella pinea]
MAGSLVCNECGKKFRSTAEAEFHANKLGHNLSAPVTVAVASSRWMLTTKSTDQSKSRTGTWRTRRSGLDVDFRDIWERLRSIFPSLSSDVPDQYGGRIVGTHPPRIHPGHRQDLRLQHQPTPDLSTRSRLRDNFIPPGFLAFDRLYYNLTLYIHSASDFRYLRTAFESVPQLVHDTARERWTSLYRIYYKDGPYLVKLGREEL